jgi:cystathionine gamma-synthase
VAIDRGYYGTHDMLSLLDREGVSVVGLDTDLERGDVVWLETPKNPCCDVEDIAFHGERAKRSGAHVVVDSTLATPVLQRPLALGADVVMHSSSKYLAGHSDALGGVLVTGDRRCASRLREQREILGAVPGSLETWLTLRSLRTLPLRVQRQSDSAAEIAQWLEPRVDRVWHPSLRSHPGFDLCRRQMKGGGGLFSFELDDAEKAKRLPGILQLFQDATSLGGVESLIEWRHKHDRQTSPRLLRVSVGLEAPDDLIEDLRRGLAAL